MHARSEKQEPMNIRAGLLAGFGILLSLWLLCGFYTVARVAEAERRLNTLNASYTHNEELLLALRYNVPMAAVYLRDNLLDMSEDAPSYYGKRLEDSRKEIDLALAAYVPIADSAAERENWAKLKTELDDYWTAITPAMQWDSDQKEFLSRRYLRQNVIRKRNLVLRISERIQILNRAAFQQRQQEIKAIYAALKRRIWWTGAGSALLGLIIAVAMIVHAARLEGQILRQHTEDQRNKNDLRRLSAQLVQIQETERRKIARELHDEVGQAITALKMELAILERMMGWRDQKCGPIEEARAIADRTLETVRDMSRLLHPAMLDDLGLPDTVRWYLAAFAQRTGIAAELALKGVKGRLQPDTELTGYRIVQEALTNVARHAGAANVWITLEHLPFSLVVSVEDDGKGFDPKLQVKPEGGLGLIGIQERVTSMGGSFWLDTAPGKGTRLRASLPAKDPARIPDYEFQDRGSVEHAEVASTVSG